MERARRIRALWNWLPAFRAVAETEHLPTAAEALHISPSSLSRTVRMLEEELGGPVFDRVGRAIQLNAAGQALLSAVRDAMRLLHEAVSTLDGSLVTGRVSLATPPFLSPLALPALTRLCNETPDLRPELVPCEGELLPALLRGDWDVVLTTEPPRDDQVDVHLLCEVPCGVFARPGHGAVGASPLDLTQVSFVAVTEGDQWPAERERKVAAKIACPQTASRACAEGDWLICVPAPVAKAQGLVEVVGLDFEVAPLKVYAVSRTPVAPHPQTDALLAALRG